MASSCKSNVIPLPSATTFTFFPRRYMALYFLADRLAGAFTTFTTKIFFFSSKKRASSDPERTKRLNEWRSLPPHFIRRVASSNQLTIYGDWSSSSSNGGETLVGELECDDDFCPQITLRPPTPPMMLRGKILPDLPDFPARAQEEGNEYGIGNSLFYPPSRIEPDLERIAAESFSVPHVHGNIGSGHNMSLSANVICDKSGRGSLEFSTPLSPPPLHLSGRKRSEVVFLPRDTPGSCPVHGCQSCEICDTKNSATFPL